MTEPVDFDDLAHCLINTDAAAEAAESHGILCGILCAEGRADKPAWIHQVLGEEADTSNALVQETIGYLERLYQNTIQELFDGDYRLQLLLPGDDVSIGERIQSLSEWCQGFLLGFSQSKAGSKGELPAEVEELLSDLVEFTKVDADMESEPGEDENALMEIEEYIRMGVIFIMETLHPRPSTPGVQ